MFLLTLIRALDSAKLDYAIAGGYAVALHGAVRGTIDIDLIINLKRKDYIKFEGVLNKLGLESKLPVDADQVFKFREEYIKNRNLIAWSFVNPKNPLELVDLLITQDLHQLKKKLIPYQGLKLKLVSLEDLIQMKSKTGRKQDSEDVIALKKIKEFK